MVKLNAPCLSLEASGKLGNAIVFADWKGRSYARQYVIPHNPKSVSQVGMRSMFKFLSQYWASLSASDQADWDDRAGDTDISPFNAFIAYNMLRARNFLAPSKLDPAAEDDLPATLANGEVTAGVRQVTFSVDITTLRENWAITIFRDISTPITPAFSNIVQVIPAESVATFTWVDSPLDPGTYYYNWRPTTVHGLAGGYDNDHSAVVA